MKNNVLKGKYRIEEISDKKEYISNIYKELNLKNEYVSIFYIDNPKIDNYVINEPDDEEFEIIDNNTIESIEDIDKIDMSNINCALFGFESKDGSVIACIDFEKMVVAIHGEFISNEQYYKDIKRKICGEMAIKMEDYEDIERTNIIIEDYANKEKTDSKGKDILLISLKVIFFIMTIAFIVLRRIPQISKEILVVYVILLLIVILIMVFKR